MSTTAAPRSLLTRLVDDAAVFPPRQAPVEQAWTEHLALRAGRYGDLLGPLLVGTADAATLVAAAAQDPPEDDVETGSGTEPVAVGIVARAGTSVAELLEAAATVRGGGPCLRLHSVELAHDAGGAWEAALALGVPVAVEVRGEPGDQAAALDDLASRAQDGPVIAKLRTQSTAERPVPTARELADFLGGVRRRELRFKLTGGLHSAVAGEVALPDGRTQVHHGVLNVLLASHYLDDHRLPLQSLEAVLELDDPEALVSLAQGLQEPAIASLRRRFVSFGCCGVTDPIEELVELGVLAA